MIIVCKSYPPVDQANNDKSFCYNWYYGRRFIVNSCNTPSDSRSREFTFKRHRKAGVLKLRTEGLRENAATFEPLDYASLLSSMLRTSSEADPFALMYFKIQTKRTVQLAESLPNIINIGRMLLHIRIFGFWWCLLSLCAVVGERRKANETRYEPHGCFETHRFVEEQARCQNCHHPSQTVEG